MVHLFSGQELDANVNFLNCSLTFWSKRYDFNFRSDWERSVWMRAKSLPHCGPGPGHCQVHTQAQGTVLYQAQGTVLYQAQGTVLYQAQGTVLYQSQGTVLYQAQGTVPSTRYCTKHKVLYRLILILFTEGGSYALSILLLISKFFCRKGCMGVCVWGGGRSEYLRYASST